MAPLIRPASRRRIQPVRPRRIVAAPSGGSAKATVITKGRVRIPRPRITASRRVVPARSGGTAPPILFQQGVRRGPTKNTRSRLLIAKAGGSAQATVINKGRLRIPRPRTTASRRVVPAPFVAAAVPSSTTVVALRRRTLSSGRPRLFRGAFLPSAAATFVRGARWAPLRPSRPRFVVGRQGIAPPSAATRALRGVRWLPTKSGRPTHFLASSAAVAAPSLQDFEESRLTTTGISTEVRTF